MIWVIFALFIAGTAGMLQTLVRAGMVELPFGIGYYQLLTLHGVILALVLTFFFIMGFQIASLSRSAGAFNNRERMLGWIGFWLMSAGTLVAAAMIATNEASVLRSEEHTSELQSRFDLVCRLLLEKKNNNIINNY